MRIYQDAEIVWGVERFSIYWIGDPVARPFGANGSRVRCRFSALCPVHPRQSCEVVCCNGQYEARPHPLDAAVDGLGPAADCFGPAERLRDPLSVFDGQGVAFVPGRSAIDGGIP